MFVRTDKRRIYPGKVMLEIFNRQLRHCAFVYNKALEYVIYHRRIARLYGVKFLYNEKFFNQILRLVKNEYLFLEDSESTSLQQSVQRLRMAFQRYLKKTAGFPKFKKYKRNPVISFTLKNNSYSDKNGTILYTQRETEDGKFRLNNMGNITLKDKRPIPDVKTTTIKIENGRWFACITYEKETTRDYPKKRKNVGIDMGLASYMTFSNRKVITKPNTEKVDAKIKKYQQKLNLCKKGPGSNKKKIQKKLQKQQNKKNDILNDFRHKTSKDIVYEYDFIAMETLDIKGMLQDGKYNAGIQDAGWYDVKQKIKYKTEESGKKVKEISQWFPSSKKCHKCGYIYKDLKPYERYWFCKKCGQIHNRDVNAAINILNEALWAEGTPVLCLVDFSDSKHLIAYDLEHNAILSMSEA